MQIAGRHAGVIRERRGEARVARSAALDRARLERIGGPVRVDVRRSVRRPASPTSRTRCDARSCSWATSRRSVVLIELSLPALRAARSTAGDAIQPAWGEFARRASRNAMDCPQLPRVRPLHDDGPLAIARHCLPELRHHGREGLDAGKDATAGRDAIGRRTRTMQRGDAPERRALREPSVGAFERRPRHNRRSRAPRAPTRR